MALKGTSKTNRGFIVSSLLLLSPNALAAAFYLSEIGTPGSLGTAGVASPTNTFGPDSSWTNPAGMTELDKDRLLAGAQLVAPVMEFESSIADAGGNDGHNAGEVALIPSFFYTRKLTERSHFGFSVVAPQGGGMDFGDQFVGRYATYEVTLTGLGFSPSLGFKVNDKFSVGAGVSVIYTSLDQKIAVNQGASTDGHVEFKDLTDWGYQPFLGLTYKMSERALLGVVYRAEMDVDLEGDTKFKNMVVTPPADEIELSWDNPQWLEAGISYSLSTDTTLFFKAGWQEWSKFSENTLAFDGGLLNPVVVLDRNWDDTWNAGIALAKNLGTSAYTLGFLYDSSPVDDDDRTIDMPFDEIFKFSGAYAWEGGKNFDYSIGTTLIYAGKGKVDQTAQNARFKGEFDTNFILFVGGTLRYTF